MKEKIVEMLLPFEGISQTGETVVTTHDQAVPSPALCSKNTSNEEIVKDGAKVYEELFANKQAPEEPKRRPKFIKEVTKPVPQNCKAAAGQACITAFSVYAYGVDFEYNDNTARELRTNAIIVGESGIGKRNIKLLTDAILEKLEKEDEIGWELDKKYKREKTAAGDRKTEERPQIKIRIIQPDITKPELNQIGDESGGKPIFMYVQEPDELDVLKGGKYGRHHFEIFKKADDDQNTAGQMRAGSKSVSAKYNLRLDYIIEMRPTQLLDFFKGEITNGARDRVSICEIKALSDKHQWPKMGKLDEKYQKVILPYIENISKAKETIVCNRAIKLINQIREEFLEYYDETQDKILEEIAHRALCRAFKRACLIYIAEGQKWDSALDAWIRWSFMYDMWQQFHYFYDAIKGENSNLKTTKTGPKSLRSLLPDYFTFEQVKKLYIDQGKYTDDESIHGTIRIWIQRKKVERTETGYHQIE